MNERKTLKRVTACGACVYRYAKGDLQLLLVRPFAERDAWGIPKGHRDGDESLEECALREVLEETGFEVSLEDRLTIAYSRFRNERKKLYNDAGELTSLKLKMEKTESKITDFKNRIEKLEA